MASHNTDGKPYIRYDDLVNGQTIHIDGSFTCRPAGRIKVWCEDGKPYFFCSEGTHWLEGQDDGDGYCVGCYPIYLEV